MTAGLVAIYGIFTRPLHVRKFAMDLKTVFRVLLAISIVNTSRPELADINLATRDEVPVFSIPNLDPRNPFYRERPFNVFGTHAEPTMTIEEINAEADFPAPAEFYKRYIKQYKPVVMRGAVKHSAAYHLWTEEYLKENYGGLTVRLEARSEDSPRVPSGIGGLGRDTVANFMGRYQDLDGYIISQIPAPMERDVSFPPFLTCGSLAQAVQEVHLFISARGGKTLLHRDPYSSVHCIFNGTKQWLVIDPAQTEKLYMSEDSRYEFGGYSDINVDDVDYDNYPNVKELEFARVILGKGDCIYMPSGYTHQVRSRGHMNSAVSIWFSHYLPFDPSGCEASENAFKPMSEASVLWRYSGQGELLQGHMDIHMLRTVMRTTADKTGIIWLEEFTNNFIQGELNDEDVLISQRLEFIKLLDPDGRGYITVEELDALSLETLKDLILIIDPSDVSNKDDFEYNHIKKKEITGILPMLHGKDPSQAFTRRDFIKVYTIYLGGSEEVAKEILAIVDPEETDKITAAMLDEHLDEALERFNTGFQHDPTIEHLWHKQFSAMNLFRKFGVTHIDDASKDLEGDLKEMEEQEEKGEGGRCSGVSDEDLEEEIKFVGDLESVVVDEVEKGTMMDSADETNAKAKEEEEIRNSGKSVTSNKRDEL